MKHLYSHIPDDDRRAAVAGFVRMNPHMNGIDFLTMMDILIDSDSYLPVIGDVDLTPEAMTTFVRHFIEA